MKENILDTTEQFGDAAIPRGKRNSRGKLNGGKLNGYGTF